MGIKVTQSSMYWGNVPAAAWGFNFKNQFFILNNQEKFLHEYISIAFKYGFNIPIVAFEENISDIKTIASKIVGQGEDFQKWSINIRGNYYSKKYKKHIFPSYMFVNDDKGDVEKIINSNDSLFQILASVNTDNIYNIYFELQSEAFFDEIWNSKTYKNNLKGVDNSNLAILNTTRLNSYIRALSILFSNYGAISESFSNIYEGETNGDSKYFEGKYFKINNEVLFYEDVFDLLPKKHKHLGFTDIPEINNDSDLDKSTLFKNDIASKEILKKMNFEDYLKDKYENKESHSWEQFKTNFVDKAFLMEDGEFLDYLKSIRCPFDFIGTASKTREIFKDIKSIENLDDETKKVIALIASGDFFKNKNITYKEWMQSKKWKNFKDDEEYSLIKIASFKNGNNYIKEQLMEMRIFKFF